LPLGAGSLCFTPAPFLATAPTLLVADSIGLGGFLPATPAPWQTVFPGVPALVDLAIQGAMAIDPQGTVAATNAVLLHTTALPQPTIASVVPPAPTVGTLVTVNGSNFLAGMGLTIGGQPVPIQTQTPTRLQFTLPSSIPCDTPLALTNPGGLPVQTNINATPVVTSIPLASGPAAGGVLFYLTGTNLIGTTVTFNGAPLRVQSQTATVIVGTTPPGTPGPAQLVIANATGCSVLRQYTYQ
jgi:hypothetical protein